MTLLAVGYSPQLWDVIASSFEMSKMFKNLRFMRFICSRLISLSLDYIPDRSVTSVPVLYSVDADDPVAPKSTPSITHTHTH